MSESRHVPVSSAPREASSPSSCCAEVSAREREPVVELLAPAGNWDCARAAVASGADAIYFGLPRFNARLRADNFTADDLPELMAFLHRHGVRGFVAFNTLVFTSELEAAVEQLGVLEEAGVDAVIVQDLGLARLVRLAAPGLELHASTQMTITSPEGLALVDRLVGLDRAVLARELSLRELGRFRGEAATVLPPLEVFVHGALCVAYSGQCLTSESLGRRSANRGECAQACRLPYELVVDGEVRDLGDRRHLLSPQDLAAVDLVPRLVELGIFSFKIEGRLKSPEYVAAVTRVYRKAIDAAVGAAVAAGGRTGRADAGDDDEAGGVITDRDRYSLEMTFSRGLSTGWLEGTDHPRLTHGRFGKKRGPLLGTVTATGRDWVAIERTDPGLPLAPGDGVVFDTGGDTECEQGGRLFAVDGGRLVLDRRSGIDTRLVPRGTRVWKTSDPSLEKELRAAWKRPLEAPRRPLRLRVSGRAGEPLVVTAIDHGPSVESSGPLVPAAKRPLTREFLEGQLGRLGATRWRLEGIDDRLEGAVMLPVSELNRLRRELVDRLDAVSPIVAPAAPRAHRGVTWARELVARELAACAADPGAPLPPPPEGRPPGLSVLVRTREQLDAALAAGAGLVYLDFEDIRRYREAVRAVRSTRGDTAVFLATPRIQKAGESGFFRLIERAEPDGVLVRNLGAVDAFVAGGDHGWRAIGDFSLNIANPITARTFMDLGFERLTISYDLNISQVLDLMGAAPPDWFELTLHQHMPMFHMEHCVFCAFLSDGHDHTDCGRPCEQHRVELRDRVGQLHPLKADVGCRNTLFRGQAQTAARFFPALRDAGLRHFRLELVDEPGEEARRLIETYHALLAGRTDGSELYRTLHADSRLGVVEGTLRTD